MRIKFISRPIPFWLWGTPKNGTALHTRFVRTADTQHIPCRSINTAIRIAPFGKPTTQNRSIPNGNGRIVSDAPVKTCLRCPWRDTRIMPKRC